MIIDIVAMCVCRVCSLRSVEELNIRTSRPRSVVFNKCETSLGRAAELPLLFTAHEKRSELLPTGTHPSEKIFFECSAIGPLTHP